MSVSILIVDDEADVAELFRQQFRREVRQGTYVMHFAQSGEEALVKLGSDIEPELIVIFSDINMPGMDGLTLLGEIKHLNVDAGSTFVVHGPDGANLVRDGRIRPASVQAVHPTGPVIREAETVP